MGTQFVIILFVVVVLWVARGFYKSFKIEDPRRKLIEDNMKDERLYDERSGKSFSVEEWDKGIPRNPADRLRLKSEDEISKYFIGVQQDIQRLRNQFIHDFGDLLRKNELKAIRNKLESAQPFSETSELNIICGAKASDSLILLICEYEVASSKSEEVNRCIVALKYFSEYIGEFTIAPKGAHSAIWSAILGKNVKKIGSSMVSLSGMGDHEKIDQICERLEDVDFTYLIHVNNNILVALCEHDLSLKNYKSLIEIVQKI